MGMSTSTPDGGQEEAISAINTTPLVDIMLVLLIIFLITTHVATKTVPVHLPNEVNQRYVPKAKNVNIAVTSDGGIFWNESPVEGHAALIEQLKTIASMKPQPEVNIRGDQAVRYEHVGRVVAAAQRVGIANIGFILEPTAP